ncbi:family 43 glycosylhydrolase [Novosphingobium profundi]|uniref:family 43 glycosylhydrolase n=1 Tax=Novosphingobium profundi TaxID=1774954 RepID=UPI001BDAED9B|nr:family 43 glycosylhydrolase [Novosphingobium profundi]MBT0669365.1 family 43 glycosylhydrolase [Novosphingobium profundi]
MTARKAKGLAGMLAGGVLLASVTSASTPGRYEAIHSGTPWFDQHGRPVSAHGAGITREGDTFYLFGEAHRDMTNAFAGFNCYSSRDLVNWRFESVALPVQASGALGPDSVGERPKVMRSPKTGEYVLFMHADARDYRDPFVGYATADRITGPYTFRGPLLFEGKPIRKWDMGVFQDADGTGYVLLHGGDIYRLSPDYHGVEQHVNRAMAEGFESPALFRKGATYYFLGSHLTGWERNDNYYYTATNLAGPWTRRGAFAPQGTLTWNSQTSFVLPIEGRDSVTYMFMGDRWSFPRQASAATYVWQPLVVEDGTLAMPRFQDAWRIDTATGRAAPVRKPSSTIGAGDARVRYIGQWQTGAPGSVPHRFTSERDAALEVTFRGTQAWLRAVARPDGGYAHVTLRNAQGEIVLRATLDMYSKYPVSSVRFVTPRLPSGTYTLRLGVVGEGWYWVSKSGARSGSSGHAIAFEGLDVRH